MPLTSLHKKYVLDYINPIDPHLVRVDRAFGNFLWLLKNNGRPVKASKKSVMLVRELAEKISLDTKHFNGLEGDRKEILGKWMASDFADVVQSRSKELNGEAVLAGLLPLHLDVVRLRHPTYARDYGTSRYIYSVARNSQPLMEELKSFFGVNIHEKQIGPEIDIETLFLVHLLDNFKDDPSSLKQEPYYPPICTGETAIFIDDLMRVLAYRNYIPRREIIRYLLTLTSFHLALSTLKTVKIVNGICMSGEGCKDCRPNTLLMDPTPWCEYRLDIFVDLTEQKKDFSYELARRKLQQHYAELSKYIKNSIRLKKLDEFAQNRLEDGQWMKSVMGLLALESHPKAAGYFEGRIDDLVEPEGGEEINTDLDRIRKLGMSPVDTYVEMLYSLLHKRTIPRYRKLLDSFCGKNLDTGFLRAGKGRVGRRYFLGSELLETLVQISVLDYKHGALAQRGIAIKDFVNWLKNRYGILIDEYGEPVENAEIAQAMNKNYSALKDRLRQLGFYADLSDASNSQQIQPRYKVI
jgi:hypothetical protein